MDTLGSNVFTNEYNQKVRSVLCGKGWAAFEFVDINSYDGYVLSKSILGNMDLYTYFGGTQLNTIQDALDYRGLK